jgi:gliding motility-associated lipoprotein GldH
MTFKMIISNLIYYMVNTARIGAVAIMFFFVSSCDGGLVYEKNERIPGNKWNRFNIPVFDVEISDTLNPHNLLINLRNTGEYPNSNIFLFISATSPGGAFIRDTIELVLAEPSGKWKGRGFGSIWQNQFTYRQNIRFREEGIYRFKVEQAMRNEELPGITDVGLRIERSSR